MTDFLFHVPMNVTSYVQYFLNILQCKAPQMSQTSTSETEWCKPGV